jgi:hypothetical protein
MHDKTNGCQMAVPSDWTVDLQAWWAAKAPNEQGDASVISDAGRTVKPLDKKAQKSLMVDELFENTPQRVFFSNPRTVSDHPVWTYHVWVPAKGGMCVASIKVGEGVSKDTVKMMAATVKIAQ